jgi:hypothetical protein
VSVVSLTEAVKALQQRLSDTTAEVDRLKDHAKGAFDSMTQLNELVRSTKYNVDALDEAMVEGGENAKGFAVIFHSLLDIQTAIADGYRERADYKGNQGANSKEYTDKINQQLLDVISRLRQAGTGQDSALAAIIENVEKELKGGIITPDEAMQVIRGLLGGFESAIIAEIGNGASEEARMVAASLERFLHGGNF